MTTTDRPTAQTTTMMMPKVRRSKPDEIPAAGSGVAVGVAVRVGTTVIIPNGGVGVRVGGMGEGVIVGETVGVREGWISSLSPGHMLLERVMPFCFMICSS